ncbi:MAG: MATE family efflux transporter [Flavobacteriales bacterium]|nr:MATE family efflux transporter [Flavobacteriales bacterium]MDW8410824.1 MATE family efflux transporter [Flavobacteriales bacterium]
MSGSFTFRDILGVYVPLLLSAMAQIIVGIADVYFLGRLEPVEQAAGNYGFLIFLVISVVGLGLSHGLHVLVARKCGQGEPKAVSALVWHGAYLMGAYALAAFGGLRLALDDLLQAALRDDRLKAEVLIYCHHRAPELFFSLPALVLNAYFVGTARTRPVSIATGAGAIINIFLDDVLIFGRFGWEAQRVAGAARATVFAQVVVFFILLLFVSARRHRTYLRWRPAIPQSTTLRNILSVSGPLFLQNGLSIVSWLLFFTLIERADLQLLEASSVVRAYYGLTLMPAIALSATVSSMVSNLLGQNRSEQAPLLARRLFLTGITFCWPWLLITVFLYEPSLTVFSTHEEVVALAAQTRWSLALSVALLPAAFVLFPSITGTGLTRFTLLIEGACLVVYLAYVDWVCSWEEPSLAWIWSSEALYHGMLGALAFVWHRWYYAPRFKVKFV